MEKDSILLGILAGVIAPVIGFVVVEFAFDMMTNMGLIDNISASTSTKRLRTIALIALCFSLIPLHFFKNKRWVNSMRGVVFPTLLYMGYWLYQFGSGLMIF